MRDTKIWKKSLVRRLQGHWPEEGTASLPPGDLCDVELGLSLLASLSPAASATGLWVLLTGYRYAEQEVWGVSQRQQLAIARHLLITYRAPYPWQQALQRYRQLPEWLRGYDVDDQLCHFVQRPVSIAVERWEQYQNVLSTPPPFQLLRLRWAEAGRHHFPERRLVRSVTLPSDLVLPPPTGHNLTARASRVPLTVSWEALKETARWMEQRVPQGWVGRFDRLTLELFTLDGRLEPSTLLTLEGVVHLIGMVSSGKSTLMDVLAVWAARNGHHVTLVVGDVVGALNRAQLFRQLGLTATPILGTSNRERHIHRLHRTLSAAEPLASPLEHTHEGFQWLSTACPLDGLRPDPQPLPLGTQPCQELHPVVEEGETLRDGVGLACPLYARCPFHQAQRDLVEAPIWIATPASLVYTRVAPQLNPERLRFAELVYRRSDLVIVDEADQVQVQLDMAFSPSQTLVGKSGDGWLDRLEQRVVPQLHQAGRSQLREERVARWYAAQEIAQRATNEIYTQLLSDSALRAWVEEADYFTDWLLFDRLATDLAGAKGKRQTSQDYQQLIGTFESYISDPLGERRFSPLTALANRLLSTSVQEHVREGLAAWLDDHQSLGESWTPTTRREFTTRLGFALLATVLQDRLDFLFRDWRYAETPLNLEGASSALFHRPPEDFLPVLPPAPMGNLLAFQYLRSGSDLQAPGDLRFFRCVGVGRLLLLRFHELFAAEGVVGPHTLLLSGTSWAGKAPGYHVQAPVTGILRAPEAEVRAIEQDSHFDFKFFNDQNTQRPIRVSGQYGTARVTALHGLLNGLARPGGLGGPSLLEQERKQLPVGRQRILLLVGSYQEARRAREFLEQLQPTWRGQVRNLEPDDDDFSSEWRGSEPILPRGLVHQLAQTDAWLLVAPLLAIERGHNILNEEKVAAIGAAYFLVRPHPRPDDIAYAIQSINRWAVEQDASDLWREASPTHNKDLTERGRAFRDAAYRRWRELLSVPLIYSALPDAERQAVAWSQLITIWQVIGRLVRGGSPAHVYFCDAAFAPRQAVQEDDSVETSLLVGMRELLAPYFEAASPLPERERVLVQALYRPFYRALQRIGGL